MKKSHAVMPSKIPAQVEFHDDRMCLYEKVTSSSVYGQQKAIVNNDSDTAAVRDKVLECWIRHLAKEMGREVTDEYVQYCIDSWHETMERLG